VRKCTIVAFMAFKDDFQALKRSLSEANIPAKELWREAGINRTTWNRWNDGIFSPRRDTWDSVLAAAERLTARSAAA
jgi:hypothetical protein